MPIVAALPTIAAVAGPIIAGGLGAMAANKAGQVQADAANKAADTQLKMFDETKANLQPFTDVGKSATYSLADLYGLPSPSNPNGGQPFNQASLNQFTNSPDYQFAKQQGIAGIDASAASRGGLLNGNQLKAVTDYSSGLATQNFGNYVSRLSDLAHLGAGTGANTGQFSASAASGIGNAQMGAGEAKASGIVGGYNALGSGLNGAFNNYLTLSRLQAPGSSSAYFPGPSGSVG